MTVQARPATKTVRETFSAISSGVGWLGLAAAASSDLGTEASSEEETAGISSVGSSVDVCWSIGAGDCSGSGALVVALAGEVSALLALAATDSETSERTNAVELRKRRCDLRWGHAISSGSSALVAVLSLAVHTGDR